MTAMLQRTRGKPLTLIVALGLLLAACSNGGGSSPTSAATANPPASGGASGSAAAGELPPPEKTDINIGLSVTETSQFAYQLAKMAGIYEKYGLNVQTSTFEGDGKALQALLAGQLDAAGLGVSSPTASQTTDSPVKAVAVNAVILSDNLVCTKDIKTADDVRGKQIAISTFGGTSHGSSILSLKALGLTPEDVVITQIGGQSARIAALEGGSVGCAVVDVALSDEMKGEGFNLLTDLTTEPLQWGRSALSFSEDFIAKNPNTVLNIVAASLEAQNMMWDDPDTAAKYYAEFTQQSLDDAKGLISDFQRIGNRTMMWKQDAFENPKEVLATVNPAVKDVDVTTSYDMSFLQKLVDDGFYEKLGIPLS